MELKVNSNKTAILYIDKNGNEQYLCPYFMVKALIKKIPADCEPEELELYFSDVYIEGTFRIPLNILHDAKMFQSICTKNYFIYDPFAAQIIQTEVHRQLKATINANKVRYENKCIGWVKFKGQDVFLTDSGTLPDGSKYNCIRDMGAWYRGSESDYDDMLNDYVFNNPKLSLAYVLGFSGVLVARITDLRDLGVLLAGISGQSTTGKTTAIKLIASIWANPNNVQGRIIMRADCSNIGFNAQFAGFNGVSIIFDDVDQNNSLDLANQLNRLSNGTQRVVCDVNGDPKFNRMGFGGICIFASECPLLEKTRKESGLYPRFLDLQDIVWTIDAKSAEEIKRICSQNFGFKGKIFAQFVERMSTDDLCNVFDESYDFINQRIATKDRFSHRSIKKYAAIIATAKLLMDCFKIQFDLEEFANILTINEERNIEDRDKPQLTYDYIKQYFIENCSSFNIITDEDSRSSKGFRPSFGIAAYRNKKLHVYIKTTTVDEILSKAGFNQLSNYKKVWKEKGWTLCAKDRYDSSTTSLAPYRHFHFVYPDYDKVLQNYITIFREKSFENQFPVSDGHHNIMQNLAPDIDTIEDTTLNNEANSFTYNDSEEIEKIFEEENSNEQ